MGSPDKQVEGPAFLASVLDALPDTFAVTDVAGVIRWVSAAGERLFGIPPSELVGRNGLELFTPESATALAEGVDQLLDGRGAGLPSRLLARRADGTALPVDIIARNLLDDPAVSGLLVQIRRVPGEVLADEFTDALAGGEPLDAVIRPLVQIAEADLAPAVCVVQAAVDHAPHVEAGDDRRLPRVLTELWPEVRALHDAGETVVVPDLDPLPEAVREEARRAGFAAVWVVPILTSDEDATPSASVWVWRRVPGPPYVTHRITLDRLRQRLRLALDLDRSHRALTRAATRDPLTGAPNRAVFFAALDHLGDAPATGRPAVLYLDLDGFKDVNDTYGHHVGDEVLRQVAGRIRRAVRAGDVYARLGGDEFAVVCPSTRGVESVVALAERLVDRIGEPVVVGEVECRVGASVGVAVAEDAGEADAALVRRADGALRRAKEAGRGGWELAGP